MSLILKKLFHLFKKYDIVINEKWNEIIKEIIKKIFARKKQ